MQKSKSRKIFVQDITGQSQSPNAYKWTLKQFQELYPTIPHIENTTKTYNITLIYQSNNISIKVPAGISTKALPYLFHKEIYKFLISRQDANPLFKTSLVVGFQSAHYDLLLDYRISIGDGKLEQNGISFNCLEFVGQGKLAKYKICKCLAIGGFSKVYLVRSLRDGEFYAMKVMLKQFICQNQKESIIENQKNICALLDHPFVVKLNHCFETHHFVCFIFQYCPGGELFYYLKTVKRMKEDQARFYFVEILYGLMHLHQQNIIYRDLKPENLLINHDGHVKIADFGLSKMGLGSRDATYSYCGSTEYMPPQMIQKSGHNYGVDFYTLGALLYELVTGLPPFYSRNQDEIRSAIVNEALTFPDYVTLSPQIKSLLSGLLQKNPKLRLGSMKGIKQILFHPWIGKMNSQAVLKKQLIPPYIPSTQQFNFDENQLGEDQQQFTQALVHQHLIPPQKERLIYKNFQYINESSIKPQIKLIHANYSYINVAAQRQNSRQKNKNTKPRQTSKGLKKSKSTKKLKKQSSQINLFSDVVLKMKNNRSPSIKSKSKNKSSSNILKSSKKLSSTFCSTSGLQKISKIQMLRKWQSKQNTPSTLKKKKINLYNK